MHLLHKVVSLWHFLSQACFLNSCFLAGWIAIPHTKLYYLVSTLLAPVNKLLHYTLPTQLPSYLRFLIASAGFYSIYLLTIFYQAGIQFNSNQWFFVIAITLHQIILDFIRFTTFFIMVSLLLDYWYCPNNGFYAFMPLPCWIVSRPERLPANQVRKKIFSSLLGLLCVYYFPFATRLSLVQHSYR